MPSPGPRDAPGFGHGPGFGSPGGHAFMEPRGDPVPAGRGRGFAVGRGRSVPGIDRHLCISSGPTHTLCRHAFLVASSLSC